MMHRSQARSFTGMGAVADLKITVEDRGGLPESYNATQVTTNAFTLLGQTPILGRDFSPSDMTPGASPVAILSFGFWERRYAKDPGILGRTISINNVPTTVIGVMAEGFSFPQNQQLWVPLMPTADLQRREARNLWFAFGHLADDATMEGARAEMETIGQRLAGVYARTNEGFVQKVQTFQEFFIGPNASTRYGALWAAGGLVSLIVCANLANLLLARAIGRSREICVRIALGAGRWPIIRQLLVESLMLSAIGAVFGWWLATVGVRAYELLANPLSWFSHVLDYSIDYRVLAYLAVISLVTALLFGLAPARRLTRLDVNATLTDGGRGVTVGRQGRRLSDLLVSAQMVLAVVLLSAAGVMTRSFLNIYTADLGVNTTNVLTMFLNLPAGRYSGPEAQIAFYDHLITRLQAVPGVESVAIAWRPPAAGSLNLAYEIAGVAPVAEERRERTFVLTISPAYFHALRAPILAGREFTATDGTSGPPVAIVNERFAHLHWPGEDPLGKRLRLFDGKPPHTWLSVIGVASNIVQNDATRQTFDPVIYLPFRQRPAGTMWVFARAHVPPATLGAAFRREIRAMDAELPIWLGPFTLAERLEQGYSFSRSIAVLLVFFAAFALLLTSIGLYASVAHAVGLRTQEIRIRMAIGASTRDILKLVFGTGMLPLAAGLTIGLAASFAVNRTLQAELVRVGPTDPISVVVAAAALIVTASIGCWIPARRAMRLDPVSRH